MKWWHEPDTIILVFWMLSFKPTFSLFCFTFIKRLFSSSSLSAIRIVSSMYLRLLIFLPAIFEVGFHPARHFAWWTLHTSWISRVTIYSLDVQMPSMGTLGGSLPLGPKSLKVKCQAFPHDVSTWLKQPPPASPSVTDNHHRAGAKGATGCGR